MIAGLDFGQGQVFLRGTIDGSLKQSLQIKQSRVKKIVEETVSMVDLNLELLGCRAGQL